MSVFWGSLAFGIVAAILSIDLWFYWRHGRDSTLSAIVRLANSEWPLFGVTLGYLIGALFGHFFW